ncbi:protein of unknown function [Maridesulfovibrio hydrothermalis AM13 = DSM 14728]|uniref:Uncharacterized protein n=1 Tax=Maridesulfovibrio hydrothermalis AM13 = DSM 14728 TaxID=1121451 RepID=L0RBG3_9BACT|nr:protein of unknown function [Maridesulfovibrio hydrothermalis AM13 = DSM 14728]
MDNTGIAVFIIWLRPVRFGRIELSA